MSALAVYVFTAMCAFIPPRQNNVAQLGAYVRVATAIAGATDDPDEALLLASIGAAESGYRENALGALKEVGVFQLRPFPNAPIPKTLAAQTAEALRRLRTQTLQGYAGCVRPCPKTVARRLDPARLYRWAHDPPEPIRVAPMLAAE